MARRCDNERLDYTTTLTPIACSGHTWNGGWWVSLDGLYLLLWDCSGQKKMVTVDMEHQEE